MHSRTILLVRIRYYIAKQTSYIFKIDTNCPKIPFSLTRSSHSCLMTLSYLPKVQLTLTRLTAQKAAKAKKTFPSPDRSPYLSASPSSHSCNGKKVAETTKLVIAFRLSPTDPPAVRALGGRTSDRTHQVTGPVPRPNALVYQLLRFWLARLGNLRDEAYQTRC